MRACPPLAAAAVLAREVNVTSCLLPSLFWRSKTDLFEQFDILFSNLSYADGRGEVGPSTCSSASAFEEVTHL